jgi:hypothetical protein
VGTVLEAIFDFVVELFLAFGPWKVIAWLLIITAVVGAIGSAAVGDWKSALLAAALGALCVVVLIVGSRKRSD